MRSSYLFWKASACAIAVILIAIAVPRFAEAKVKCVYPDQFKTSKMMDDYDWQTVYSATRGAASSDSKWYWTKVKFPVGAEITRLKYYHWSESATGKMTQTSLMRFKMGQGVQTLAECSSNTQTPVYIEVEDDTIDIDPIVRRNYIYYLGVLVEPGTGFAGVKIYYRSP